MANVKYRIKNGDQVQVITGVDKGQKGKVLKVDKVTGRVIVQGLNLKKKAKRRTSQQDKGGIVEIEAPINISNLMIICKKCGPTRVGYRTDKTEKVRVCKKCGETL